MAALQRRWSVQQARHPAAEVRDGCTGDEHDDQYWHEKGQQEAGKNKDDGCGYEQEHDEEQGEEAEELAEERQHDDLARGVDVGGMVWAPREEQPRFPR